MITRSQANGRRALWVLALVLFAVSATHLGSFHSRDDSWWMQLLGHHAAIPLAFAILYQNYRFALGDLFLKQALTLLAIVAVTLAGYSAVLAVPPGPAAVGVLLGAVGGHGADRTLAAARGRPLRRRGAARPRRLRGAPRRTSAARSAINRRWTACMDTVCDRLAGRVQRAPRVVDRPRAKRAAGAGPAPSRTAIVPTTDPPQLRIHVGELTGGRRLLSDDRRCWTRRR